MSETDDTDDLLLIPPDFFIIEAGLEEPYLTGPYYDVVDSLIAQVNKLEDRINIIESTSDVSLVSNSLDYSVSTGVDKSSLMSGVRKYSSSDDIRKVTRDGYFESTQSTPQKPQTRFKLNSLSSSPSLDQLSPRKFGSRFNSVHSNQHKSPTRSDELYRRENVSNANSNDNKEEMLREIDHFISNIQTQKTQSGAVSRKRQNVSFVNGAKCDIAESNSQTSLTLNDLDYMLKQVESQEKQFDAKQRNDVERVRKEERVTKEQTWRCGDDRNSVPDYGYQMRDAMYGGRAHDVDRGAVAQTDVRALTVEPLNYQGPSTSDLSTTCTESFADKTESVSSSSSECTQLTALPNVSRGANNGTTRNSEVFDSNALRSLNFKRLQSRNNYSSKVVQESNSPPKNEYRRARRNILDTSALEQNKATSKVPNRLDNHHRLLSLSHLWSQGDRNKEVLSQEANYLQKLEEEKLRRQHCEQLIQQLQLRTLELQERLAVAVQVDGAKDDAILRFHNAWEQVAIRLQSLTNERYELEKEISEAQVRSSNDLAEAAKKVAHFESEASKALNLAHSSQEKLSAAEKHCNDLTQEIQSLTDQIASVQIDYDAESEKTKQLLESITQKEIELSESKNVLSDARNEIAQSKRAVEVCQAELTSMKTQYTHLELLLNEKKDTIKTLEAHNKKFLAEIDTHKKIEKDLQQELNKTKELGEKNKHDLRNFYQDQVEIVVRDKLKEFQSQLDRAETSLQDELRKRELTIAKSAAMHIQQITDKHSLEVRLLEEKHSEEVRLYQVQLSQAQQHIENLQYKFQQQQQRKSDVAQQLHKVMEAQWLEALKIINNGRSPIVSQDQDVTLNQLNLLKSKSHSNLEEVLSMDVKTNQYVQDTRKKVVDVPPLNFGPSTSSMNGDVYQMETPLSSRPRSKQQIEIELQKYVQMLLNKSPGNPTDEPFMNETQKDNEQYTWQPPVQDDYRKSSGLKDRKLKPPWK